MTEIAAVICQDCGAEVRTPRGLLYHGPQCPMTPERRLVECEEALRSTEREYAAFREQMLAPIKREHASIESMSWDDLLGVAVRNLNHALELDAAIRLHRDKMRNPIGRSHENDSLLWATLSPAETGQERPDA